MTEAQINSEKELMLINEKLKWNINIFNKSKELKDTNLQMITTITEQSYE